MELNFTQRFIEGLKEYGLTMNDMNNFVYKGGNNGSHLNYYKLSYKNDELPPDKDICICGHKIIKNCYISNGSQLLTLGICCIKRFIPKEKQRRTCECCGCSHKNRKNNLCNICREKSNITCKCCGYFHKILTNNLCNKCIEKPTRYKNNKLINICIECGIDICDKFKYSYCYYCLDDIKQTPNPHHQSPPPRP